MANLGNVREGRCTRYEKRGGAWPGETWGNGIPQLKPRRQISKKHEPGGGGGGLKKNISIQRGTGGGIARKPAGGEEWHLQ